MRKFYALLTREVTSYFYSPIAYIVLIFFLKVLGGCSISSAIRHNLHLRV